MSNVSSLDAARIDALKAYSDLEYQLALLLRFITGVNPSTAWAIFHQITNTRARYAIIGNILDTNARGQFRPMWRRIEGWLNPIDTARNHIVHWIDEETIDIEAAEKSVTLTSVRILTNAVHAFSMKKMDNTYDVAKVKILVDDIEIMRRIVNRFGLSINAPKEWPWTEIILQPPARLTPAEFLRLLTDKESSK